MDELNLGDKVYFIDSLDLFQNSWTITSMDGDNMHCIIYDDAMGWQTAIIHKSLLKKGN